MREGLVWFATSDDVPGFALEYDSLDRLCERVLIALPDFLSEDIAKGTGVIAHSCKFISHIS